jgi:hypothetical protein
LRLTDGSYTRLGDYVFGPAGPSSGTSPTGLLRWDGTGIAGGFVQIANGPKNGRSVATWLNRVWVLGGTVPGGAATSFKNRLYWSDPSWDGTDVLTAWQDDVTGLANQIVLDEAHDDPVALAVFNRALLVLRKRSILAVTGTSPANFSVRAVAHIGCASSSSVVVHDSGVYFLSDHGYVVYDGASVQNVSMQVEDTAFAKMRGDLVSQPRTTAGLLDADNLILSGVGFAGIMHIPSRSWTSVALDGIDATNPGRVGQSLNHPFVITSATSKQRVCLLDHICSPEVAVATGSTFQDFGSVAYGGTCSSRIIELASPESKASLHRILADSKPLGATGFTVTVAALDGTVLKTVSIPSSANNWVQRTVADLDGIEADFVRLKWALTSATGPVEIQDAQIEFQAAQERTG